MATNKDNDPADYFTYELDKLFVIPIYFLSFVVGIPLNGYIIYRLYIRGIKGSYYYKLLMLMSVIDIYIACFYTVEYYNAGSYHTETAQYIALYILNAIQTFFTLIVVVYWKTVVKKLLLILRNTVIIFRRKKLDKFLYSMPAMNFILFFIMIIHSLVEFRVTEDFTLKCFFIGELVLGLTTAATFLTTSIVCIYCLLVVLLADTNSYSAQTLRAYKRMAVAHFVQCILAEIDIIAQNLTVSFVSISTSATELLYYGSIEVDSQHLPSWVHSVLKLMVVFTTLFLLIPVIKPFTRSTFIAWALRRLLATEKTVVIRVQPTSTIRSTTKDN